MRITGVFPPIATPFGSDGAYSAEAMRANILRWNETGLAGYVVAGSNGESALLTFDEAVQAVATVREAALAEQLVIAGAGRQSTAETIRLTRAVAKAGADAALVMTPFFYGGQMTSEALVRHFGAVADASPIPVIAYNVPKFTHLNMAPEAVAQLADHENVVGLKDSAGNIGQIIDLVRLCPPDFSILVGNAPAYMSAVQAGASGGILALANVAPRECVAIWNLLQAGKDNLAREIQFRMMPVGKAVTSGYGIPGLKAALDALGYQGGTPRPPLMPASGAVRQAIADILDAAGLLSQ